MTLKLLDLKPDRQLIDPEFNGYKLSLDTIPILKKELDDPVYRIFPDSNQYSFLHTKLIGLHNHLIGETFGETDIVYIIDEAWCIIKLSINQATEKEVQILDVIHIPNPHSIERRNGSYNACLKLITDSLAVFSDGAGKLYVLQTDNRKENNKWKYLFSECILDDGKYFIIQDARFQTSDKGNIINCLLYSIEQKKNETKNTNILHWITLTETDKVWKKSSVREIDGDGVLYYAHFETSCEALYLISDGCFQFVQDFDESMPAKLNSSKKKYCWTQTTDEVTIQLKLPENINMDSLCISTTSTELSIKIDDEIVLNGILCHEIENNLTNWSVDNGILEIVLSKKDDENMWTSLIVGDDSGEYVVDATLAEQVHDKLTHLCSGNQISAPLGTTFNSEQVEECDFEQDKYTTFERLSGVTREVTHKVNVNTHTLLLTVQLSPDLPPAVAFRHDVDAYIWQPKIDDENFTFTHEGTLNAFGYVQASKQQRKFSVCAPDYSYCAICETSRHLFIYRQRMNVNSGELRHRITGKRIGHVAQQQVVNLPGDEVLGIYAATSRLFILTVKSVYVLTL